MSKNEGSSIISHKKYHYNTYSGKKYKIPRFDKEIKENANEIEQKEHENRIHRL